MISLLLHGFQYLSTVKTHRCKNEKYTTDCQKWTSQKLGSVNLRILAIIPNHISSNVQTIQVYC